jgi:hypothetical protein
MNLIKLSAIVCFVFLSALETSGAQVQCVFDGQQWVFRYPNGSYGLCPSHMIPAPPMVAPYPGANPPTVAPYPGQSPTTTRPYPEQPQQAEKVYDATCFNIRNTGSFASKTVRELVSSEEAQLIGTAICTYYSGEPTACRKTAKMGADIANKLNKHDGSDYYGQIFPRPGYEVCRAFWDEGDWSVTGDVTFHTELGRGSLNYMVSMKVGDRRGHFVDTKVILEQVPIGTAQSSNCWPPGTIPWTCKGSNCRVEMPGARVNLSTRVRNPALCINLVAPASEYARSGASRG